MRWKYETDAERRAREKEWRPWFAWRPVLVDCPEGTAVWLERIERCRYYGRDYYRIPEETL